MEAAKSPDEFKMGHKSESASGDNIGKWDKPGIKSDSQKYQMIDENSFPGYKSDRSSNGNIGHNPKDTYKSDASVKGAEAMRESEPMIHENSRESEILCDPSEYYQDLTFGDALEKRAQFNGGALNSSDKQDKTKFQQIYGLTEESEGQADDPMNNPTGY